jgi:hypothetical protein
LKLYNIWGDIDWKPISRMLIEDGTAINLMSYSIFKMLEREDDELMKTNLILNSVGGNPMDARVLSPWRSPQGASHSLPLPLSSRCKITIASFLPTIGFMPNVVFLLLCTNS